MMYDDLVKRLRREAVYLPEKFSKNAELLDVLMKAAGAIENTSKAYQMMAEAYEAEVTKHCWIPVTERLPELDQEVLVYAVGKIDGFIGSSVYALTKRFLFKFFPSSKGTEEWKSPWLYFMEDYEITHWMPLPKPLKEQTE